ncbi:serine/threonine-protein phosphatase 6 regulatory subunit 3-like isoform X2 [Strongylocentrotus purpuratus]|uniref:Serine/threonine-protein phosphatase 6 regulatory subunit 3 n=1 Tax=Strongylocentrotus purpuratus TaxID=7668 RepID=A0A7M7PEG6_STRPU|nr:serine/threonine-protein phosphatase 6 regulatory subunit 3-like isoform X2 [Strongylocentrotus purpuratus]
MMHAASDTFAMFWRFGMPTTSHIDTLLEKEDITLSEVLEEDDVLQECKGQNRKLIDFLVRTDVIEELVNLITSEPSQDLHESVQYKNPNMACELLTSDVAAICDKLADTETAFTSLWKFLDRPAPLNPLLASFFSKTIGSLLSRRPEVVVEFIKGREDCIGLLLSHLEVSAIMDLILRLITCIESPEIRIAFLNWLNDQRFIQRLVDLIDTEQSEDTHSNAAQTLCDIVRLTREHMSQLQECADNDPLLTTIEMEETVSELLDHMFKGTITESAIVNGISILLSLLEFRKQGAAWALSFGPDGQEQMTQLDAERLARGVSGTLKAVVSRLADMQQLLEDPPGRKEMSTTVGKLEPPLGNVRLQISKLVSSLLITNTAAINAELARLGTIKKLVDLFLTYAWNNFLHLEVEKSISTILSNNPTESEEGKTQHPLLVHLFTESKLIPKVMEAWEENDIHQKQGRSRRGYMGHMTRIANVLTQEMEKGCNNEQIKSLYQEYIPEDVREKWSSFLAGSLAETNKRNLVELVGTHPLHSSSEDDDSDFKDIDFGKDTALQQAFSDYQMQQMTSHFIDQFGFNDEEFAEQEENVNNPFDRISDINFSISANEDNPNSALFEACCNERVQPFNDSNSDEEDIWEEKELTYTANNDLRSSDVSSKNEGGSDQANHSSSDEDEDGDNTVEEFPPLERAAQSPLAGQNGEDTKMDVDSENTWQANFEQAPVAMDTTPSGWEQPSSSTATAGGGDEDTGWANFNEFNANFTPEDGSHGPRSSSPVAMESEPSSQDLKETSEAMASSSSPSSDVQSSTDTVRSSAYVVSSSSSDQAPVGEGSPNTSTEAVQDQSEEKAMVVEPATSSPVDNRISQEANVPTSHQSNDQTLNNAVSSSSDPKGTLTNAAPVEPQVPMDLPVSNPVQSKPDTAAIVQNDCKSPVSSNQVSVNSSLVSSVISSQDSTSLNIPLSNSNPNSHADNSPSPSSVSPSLTSADLPSSEKCGMSNTALHTNPGQCIPTMGCNAADPNNLSPVENSSNHTMVNDVGNTDIGINIKADLKMELSEEVPSPTTPTTPTTSPVDGDSSPEAAVTISPVAVQEESNNVHSDLVNNDANLSPEGDTADKLSFIAKSEFMKSGASSQSPSSPSPNGPLDLQDSQHNRNDSSDNIDIQVTAVTQNGPV